MKTKKIFLVLCALFATIGYTQAQPYTNMAIYPAGSWIATGGTFETFVVIGEPIVGMQVGGNYEGSTAGFLAPSITTAIMGEGVLDGCFFVASGDGNIYEYNISGYTNAETYTWSIINGTIVGGNGTETIQIEFDNGATEAELSITPSNSYGDGTQADFSIELDPEAVFPGDVNYDGVCDILDFTALIEELNYFFDVNGFLPTGTARSQNCFENNTYDWIAQPAHSWGATITNGADIKNIDADGSGEIVPSATYYTPALDNPPTTDGQVIKYNIWMGGDPSTPLTHYGNTAEKKREKNDDFVIRIEPLSYPETPMFGVYLQSTSKQNIRGINGRFSSSNATVTDYSMSYSNSHFGILEWDMLALDVMYQDNKTIDYAINRTDLQTVNFSGNELIYELDIDLNERSDSTILVLSNINVVLSDGTVQPCSTTDSLIITGDFVSTEHVPEQKINIYPNPATTTLQITNANNTQVEFFDITGKQVTVPQTSENSFDVSHLNAGVYILKITSERGIITEKVIIQ